MNANHRPLCMRSDVKSRALSICAPRMRGFTLVELMVALAIASILLLALATMFINTSISRGELDKSSRQIESGRYAMQILSDEIRHAGYYGAIPNAPTLPGTVTSLPDPCTTVLADVQTSIGLPLQGYPGKSTAAALDTGKLGCLNAAAGYKANTGVIVVRRADTSIAAVGPTSGFYNIQTSGCAGDATRYAFDSYLNTGSFTLHANTAPGCLPLTTAPIAQITPVYIRIFYVSTCSDVSCSAGGHDSVPTLKRMDITPAGASAPVSLVDGIENLQFEYGIDSALTDGTPDAYLSAPAFADWQNVMAVRVHVLARNLEATSGYSDKKTYTFGTAATYTPSGSELPYRRHAYSELVRLNNPSGRRE
jgi:type IV pilus assembly protein PilW